MSVLSAAALGRHSSAAAVDGAAGAQGARSSKRSQLSGTKLVAPILYPGTIFCAGANYRDHVAEMARALNLPAEPDPPRARAQALALIKASAACVPDRISGIALPAYSKKVDWEPRSPW